MLNDISTLKEDQCFNYIYRIDSFLINKNVKEYYLIDHPVQLEDDVAYL